MTRSQKSIADADALIIYRVGPVYCCSPTLTVESVIMPPSLTHTPGVNEAQPGVFKYSSGVVRVVDLRKRFGVEKEQWQKPGRIIIAEVTGGHAGFWVDEIIDVVQMPMTGWSSLPAQIPRDVFSKTLLLDDVIHLYAEFERLDAFKETGYLRQHIEMLLERAAKKQVTPTNHVKTSGTSDRHNEVGRSRTSVELKPDDLAPEVQANQHDVDEIKVKPSSAQSSVAPTVVNEAQTAFTTNIRSTDQNGSTKPPLTERPSPLSGQTQPADLSRTAKSRRDTVIRSPSVGDSIKDDGFAEDGQPVTSVPGAVPKGAATRSDIRTDSPLVQANPDRQLPGNLSGVKKQPDNVSNHLSMPSMEAPTQAGRGQSVQDAKSGSGGGYLLLLMLLVLIPVAWYGVTEWQQASLSNTAAESVKIPIKSEVSRQFELAVDKDTSLPVLSDNNSLLIGEAVPEQVGDIRQMSVGEEPVVDDVEYRADIERDEEGIVIVLSRSSKTMLHPEAIAKTGYIDESETETEIETEIETEVEIETVAVDVAVKEKQTVLNAAEVDSVEPGKVQVDSVLVKEMLSPRMGPGVAAVVTLKESVAEVAESTQVIVHVVVKGDTLWHIAKRYVKNPFLYPELARLSKIKNPDLIFPGDRVKIILKN